MEIKQYLSIARRWSWLLILGLLIGTLSGYGFARIQTPVYEATTRVMVSRASMQAASGTGTDYISDQQLIQTYIELLKASTIFETVSQDLNYPISSEQVLAAQVGATRILSISVTDTDPKRAADIANALVAALIKQNEELEAGRYSASEENLQSQIEQVETQITSLQSQIDTISNQNLKEQITQAETEIARLQEMITPLQKEIDDLKRNPTAEAKLQIIEKQSELDRLNSISNLYQQAYANLVVLGSSGDSSVDASSQRLSQIENTLSLYQEIYINLLQSLETVRFSRLQNTQSINQIQAAIVPEFPVSPQPLNSALLAGVVGLMLAAGIIFLIEYLDDTMKIPEDVDRVLGIPLIGYIAEMRSNGKEDEEEVYVSRQPRSPVSEAFRSLRTNLEFAAVDKPLRTILVTGAEVGDGKTTVACNLATIFAQGGKRVLLLDCDLRRPRVHRFLGIPNRLGLTDLLRGNLSVESVTHQWADSNSKTISVITTGMLPPNPAELLGSNKMDQVLAAIASHVDMVVIDSPPSLVSDAQILAAKVDCVLLVVQPGKTHIGAALATRQQLDRAGARIVGAVFNRIPRSQGYYYGGYHYYTPYYSRNDQYLSGSDLNVKSAQAVEVEQEPQPASLLSKTLRDQKPSDR